jgi:hypothetical protein
MNGMTIKRNKGQDGVQEENKGEAKQNEGVT